MTSLASLASSALNPSFKQYSAPARSAAEPQQTLANRLAERLGLKPEELGGKAKDYSPEKVSDRIVNFVAGNLARAAKSGASAEELQNNLQQFRSGVEKGFADARAILDGFGVLNGEVAANIDDTYKRIQDGLDELQQNYSAPAASNTGGAVAVAAYSERFEAQAQTFDLEVTTRDGDKLRISVAQASASYSQSSVFAASNGSDSAVLASSSSSSLQIAGFQISVEGELDDEERASLSALFTQVQDLSDEFFAGDLQGAFDQALKLELDGSQLASMSLNLTQTTVRQATDAYSAVAKQGGQPASAVNGSLIDYAKGMLEALRTSSEVSADGRGTLEQLLNGSLALDDRFDKARIDKASSFNQLLLDGLQLLIKPVDEAAAEPVAEPSAVAQLTEA
jgi:hypothetical protein